MQHKRVGVHETKHKSTIDHGSISIITFHIGDTEDRDVLVVRCMEDGKMTISRYPLLSLASDLRCVRQEN